MPSSDDAVTDNASTPTHRRLHHCAQRVLGQVELLRDDLRDDPRAVTLLNDIAAEARRVGDVAHPSDHSRPVDVDRLRAMVHALYGHLPHRSRGPVDSVVTMVSAVEDMRKSLAAEGAAISVPATSPPGVELVVSPTARFSEAATPPTGPLEERVPTMAAFVPTVLVIDDDEGRRHWLIQLLAQRLSTRVEASSLEQGRVMAASEPSLVLVAESLAQAAVDALRQLAAGAAQWAIPLIVVHATLAPEYWAERGAVDAISVALSEDVLMRRVTAYLAMRRLRVYMDESDRQRVEWVKETQRLQDELTRLHRFERLKRFFSPQLAQLIVAAGSDDPLRTHRRDITVVFADLRGFTAFAETADPEEVMNVLREYHVAMGELILEYEGTLERFSGDGLMIFFNDPIEVPNPAERAVRMSVAMRDRARDLKSAWQKKDYDLSLGIGIASGFATIGAVGFEGRLDYAAIGTVTNLASRLCADAKADEILIPQKLLSQVEGLVEVAPLGEVSVRGLSRPVHVFKVIRLVG